MQSQKASRDTHLLQVAIAATDKGPNRWDGKPLNRALAVALGLVAGLHGDYPVR